MAGRKGQARQGPAGRTPRATGVNVSVSDASKPDGIKSTGAGRFAERVPVGDPVTGASSPPTPRLASLRTKREPGGLERLADGRIGALAGRQPGRRPSWLWRRRRVCELGAEWFPWRNTLPEGAYRGEMGGRLSPDSVPRSLPLGCNHPRKWSFWPVLRFEPCRGPVRCAGVAWRVMRKTFQNVSIRLCCTHEQVLQTPSTPRFELPRLLRSVSIQDVASSLLLR